MGEQGWIPVSARLPEGGPWVLILYDDRSASGHPDDVWHAIACLADGRWVHSTGEREEPLDPDPDYWRPLPEPPGCDPALSGLNPEAIPRLVEEVGELIRLLEESSLVLTTIAYRRDRDRATERVAALRSALAQVKETP